VLLPLAAARGELACGVVELPRLVDARHCPGQKPPFWLLSAQRHDTKAPRKTDLLWKNAA
jgi:hypothetical protein